LKRCFTGFPSTGVERVGASLNIAYFSMRILICKRIAAG
jgi:hypothetical protein